MNTLSLNPLLTLGNKLYGHKTPIFMLHRMTSSALGVKGHDPALLRFSLEFLRKHKFNLVTIDDIAHSVKTQTPLPAKSVAFTLDDGYFDQVDIATDIFSEFDCPATFYVTTGFVDSDLWFWSDKIQFIVENCNAQQLGQLSALFPKLPSDFKSKESFTSQVNEELKLCSLGEINRLINTAADMSGIAVPSVAPEKYRATSWADLRKVEKRGMMVGAHTHSHPVLSREDDETSKNEIERSTLDVRKQLQAPSKVFCYPVGRLQDFKQREVDCVKRLGYIAGVTSEPGAMSMHAEERLFSMPRFSYPDTKGDFIQYATWIESFKNQLRRL